MARRKKMSAFWKVYIVIGLLLLGALGVWLCFLYNWLGDYESAQPKYLAEDTFNEHFADFDAAEYIKLCNTESFLETEENIVNYLETLTEGKEITYKKVSSGLESGYKYIVLCSDGENETKFASFTLTEDGDADSKFKTYTAGGYEIYTDSKTTVTVEAPKGYTVLVNGDALSETFITENDIPTDSCNHMPEGVSGLYYTKYTVNGLLTEPTVEVKNGAGESATVEKVNNSYKAQPVSDAALSAEYTEWVLKASELYARYTQYDSNVNVTGFNQVAPYFDPSSELYESIRTVDNMFVQYYDDYEFKDMTASEFVRYDENTFSCRVQYTQLLYQKNDVYDDFVDQTLYLRKVDGEYLIYDMNVN